MMLVNISCSRINQSSKDYYDSKKIRHGIIPLNHSVVQKLDQASVKRGEQLYKEHCLSCHGIDGEGKGPITPEGMKPVNLRKVAREVKNFKFFMSISQWQGDMPGWKETFDDKQREDLVAYIKSL